MQTRPGRNRRAWKRGLAALLLALVVLLGMAQPGTADPRPPGAAEGTKLAYYDDPFARQAFLLRMAVRGMRPSSAEAFSPFMNAASVLIDPRALSAQKLDKLIGVEIDRTGIAFRAAEVDLYEMERYLPPAVFKDLRKAGEHKIVVLSALNLEGIHSEIAIEKYLNRLGISKLAGYSERRQCRNCTTFYDSETPTFYSHEYDLTPQEMKARQSELAAAAQSAKDPKAKLAAEKQVIDKYEKIAKDRNAAAAVSLDRDLVKAQADFKADKDRWTEAASSVLRAFPPGGCGNGVKPPGLVLGLPPPRTLVRAAFAAAPCGGQRAPSGLAAALTGLGNAPGGIDFSSLQLRYLADPSDGSGLQYSFSASRNLRIGDSRAATGLAAAQQSSDAFFVWLELKPSTFWVNLNPTEPHRIVDARLGRTDAGRILLQADLRMKKTTSQLIHPDTVLGKRFWNELAGNCLSNRIWIVPAQADIHEDGDKLYILSAPLDVQMEIQYLRLRPGRAAATCPQQDKATERHNEQLYRSLVLPRLKHAINTAPEYADLRRVYLSRVAAEWYRTLSKRRHTAYGGLVDGGDIGPWTTKTGWKPVDTFNQFVDSYTKGEFKITRRTTEGNVTLVRTYVTGGVDFSNVRLAAVSAAEMNTRYPGLPRTVQASTENAETSPDGSIWLGGTNPVPGRNLWTRFTDRVGSFVGGRASALAVILIALAAVTFGLRGGTRRRQRPAS